MFEWIISSGILIIIIVALRNVLKGKISLRLQYALWGLVLLRLLVPFSIGNSSISVMNVADKIAEQSVWQPEIIPEQGNEQEKEQDIIPSEVINNPEEFVPSEKVDIPGSNREEIMQPGEINNPGYDSSRYDRDEYEASDKDVYRPVENNRQEYSATDVTDMPMQGTENPDETKSLTFAEVLVYVKKAALYVWAGGIILAGSYFVFVNIRFSVLLKKNRRLLEHIEGYRLPVYVAENIDTPCMYGLFRPVIYVTPEVRKSEKVLKHVLEHESTHYRHADHIWCVLRGIALVLHWYNPLVWLAAVLSRNDSELACDEGTIKRIGENERADYGRTLIEMTCQKHSALFVNATTMTGSKKSIKERIVLIAKKPKMAIYTLIAVVVIAAIAVGCTFTGAGGDTPTSQNGEENPRDEQETTTGEEETTTGEEPTTPEEQPTTLDEPPTTSGDEKETTEDKDLTEQTEGTAGSVKWRIEGDTIIFSGTGKLDDGSWAYKNFKHVVIEDGITELDWFAFSNNDNIESLVIPGSVETAVGFADCKNLKSITLGEGIKRIEECAFEKSAIEKIFIPDSVTSIGGNAFVMCENLKEIEYNGKLERCGDFVFVGTPWLDSKQKENPLVILGDVIVDATKATGEVVIPEGVTQIGDYVFCESEGVTSVIMPESLKGIGWRAFYGVISLEEVTFKGAIETVADEAFLGCTGLKKIEFNEGLVSIGYEAFAACYSLERVVLPESLEELGVRAFWGCDELIDVVIPEGFTGFGGDDFAGTAWLEAKKKENPVVVVNGVLIDATSVEGSLVIPEGVTRIASYACYSSDYITDIVIPEGVTVIDSCAFTMCKLLTSVTIPESVTYIEPYSVFGPYKKPIVIYGKKGSYAENYVKNYYEEGDLVFEPVFDYTWRLERDTVIISGTGKLEEGSWRNAVFKTVIIEEGTTIITSDSFAGCTKVEKVVIPSSVTCIEAGAFDGCTNLAEIEFPETFIEFGDGVFDGTKWLAEKRKENALVIVNDTLIDAKSAVGEVVVPDGVRIINEFAFAENSEITSVILPESLEKIENEAFYACIALEKIVLPKSLKKLERRAFQSCISLKEIGIPEGFTEFEGDVFAKTAWLREKQKENPLVVVNGVLIDASTASGKVVVPMGVKCIAENAFYSNTYLEGTINAELVVEVVLSDSVTTIKDGAFSNCFSMKRITIPENVVSIGEYAFDLEGLKAIRGKAGSYAEIYAKLKAIAFEPTLTYDWRVEGDTLIISGTGIIDDGAWQYENFKNVIIEEGIEGIDSFTFNDRTNIVSLVIPSTLKCVWGFAGCRNLKNITIADGVEQIDESAFERCHSLEKIVIPDSVKGISLWAFAGCISLKDVVFEGTVPGISPYAFEGTPWFEAKKNEGPFVIIEGTIIYVDNERVSGDVVIPDGITHINEIAFTGNQKITSVTFPGGFAGIGENAFSGCDNLTKLIFKGSLSYVAWGAFSGCGGLTEVVLPEGTEKIGMEAFWGCKKLERVVMPDTVTSIGTAAFEQCENLKDIVISKNCFDFGEYAFSATQWLHDRRAENPIVKVNGVIIDSKSVVLKDIDLSDEIFNFYKSADGISMTLYTAEGGKYNTYTMDYASSAASAFEMYTWVQTVGMDDYIRDYWIEIKPVGGEECITVYDDGAGLIKYFDGTDYSYWVAKTRVDGIYSYAKAVRIDYDNEDYADALNFVFDGSAKEAAEYFVNTVYGDIRMNKLAPGSMAAITFYELIEYNVLEISEDDTKVVGTFKFAYDAENVETNPWIAGNGGDYGEGKYEGMYTDYRYFRLFKMENNQWNFSVTTG